MSTYEFLYDGKVVGTRLDKEGGNLRVTMGETSLLLHPLGPNQFFLYHNGRRMNVAAIKHKDRIFVDIDSVLLELKEATEENVAGGAGEHGADPDKIFAPMPGKIVKICVELGQEVNPKQQMVIVEAMKMENPVLCRAKGTVKAINFKDGDQVDTESPIIELELIKE